MLLWALGNAGAEHTERSGGTRPRPAPQKDPARGPPDGFLSRVAVADETAQP
jgi:hypothetical protein